jgi:S-adenosylmethionine hydrolase
MPFATTFGDVPDLNLLCYVNSLLNISFAINMESFADSFHIQSGPEWKVVLAKNKMGK